jgi:outer membrane protein assembly factor BamB
MQMQLKSASLASLVILAVIASSASAAPDLLVSDRDAFGQDAVRRFNGQTGAAVNLGFIPLLGVTGVTVGPDSNVYVGTDNPGEVFRYNPGTGAQIGSGPFVDFLPPGSPNPDNVTIPQGMHFGPDGKLYIADEGGNQNIHIYNADGTSNRTLDNHNDLTLPLLAPTSVAFDSSGKLYVANQNGANILRYNSATDSFSEFVPVLSGGLTIPTDLTFGADQKLYVVDGQTSDPKILRYNSNGTFDQLLIDFGQTTFQPWGLVFGPDGKLYVSGTDLAAPSPDPGRVLRYLSDGTPDGTFVSSGLASPTFLTFVPEPTGLLGCFGMLLLGARRRQT